MRLCYGNDKYVTIVSRLEIRNIPQSTKCSVYSHKYVESESEGASKLQLCLAVCRYLAHKLLHQTAFLQCCLPPSATKTAWEVLCLSQLFILICVSRCFEVGTYLLKAAAHSHLNEQITL